MFTSFHWICWIRPAFLRQLCCHRSDFARLWLHLLITADCKDVIFIHQFWSWRLVCGPVDKVFFEDFGIFFYRSYGSISLRCSVALGGISVHYHPCSIFSCFFQVNLLLWQCSYASNKHILVVRAYGFHISGTLSEIYFLKSISFSFSGARTWYLGSMIHFVCKYRFSCNGLFIIFWRNSIFAIDFVINHNKWLNLLLRCVATLVSFFLLVNKIIISFALLFEELMKTWGLIFKEWIWFCLLINGPCMRTINVLSLNLNLTRHSI